jgi:wyosine [tRNA(Phe)-imidazoG37] synthetase (radical SAM superfamily)
MTPARFTVSLQGKFLRMSILFDDIVFGPVKSRRLGSSLGINLLPLTHKICSFDCAYCECGWTENTGEPFNGLMSAAEILAIANVRFIELQKHQIHIDAITFAGNGEPTLHPEFSVIIDGIIALRNSFLPKAKIAVLSNASMLHKPEVFAALSKIWYNIQKLDAGTERMFRLLNRPIVSLSLQEVVENLCRFNGNLMIQTLLVKGEVNGEWVDNTQEEELEAWFGHLVRIKPRRVMLYPIDRQTPASKLRKVDERIFESVKQRLDMLGIASEIYL